MKISNEVANVLANSRIDGQELFLPSEQLDRKLYLAVNKVLEAIGGKWSRGKKAHVFDCYPEYKIEEILLIGEYTDAKKEYQFFETPPELTKRLVDMAEIQPGESILEPSAGRGAILWHICYELRNMQGFCDCVELYPENRQFLTAKLQEYNLVGDDFLQFHEKYDVIIANPPFTRQQDITHVIHMIKLANRRVVSVMSASVLWRDNKKTKDFRQLIEDMGGTIKPLPDDSFKESGTRVRTCVCVVDVK